MGLDIHIESRSDKDIMEWDFNGRRKWGDFILYMEHEFDYKCAENMPLTKPIIDKMIGDLIYNCKEIDAEENYFELTDKVQMIEALLYCRSAINNGGEATWEADW